MPIGVLSSYATVHQGKVYVKLCLECGLEAMVAWSWPELAVYGIKDSPKKESEILIKMFHIIMSYDSLLLIKRKWMENIVLDMLRLRAQYFFCKASITHHDFLEEIG